MLHLSGMLLHISYIFNIQDNNSSDSRLPVFGSKYSSVGLSNQQFDCFLV